MRPFGHEAGRGERRRAASGRERRVRDPIDGRFPSDRVHRTSSISRRVEQIKGTHGHAGRQEKRQAGRE